jgi:uncharacterized HhH-GPD family protein
VPYAPPASLPWSGDPEADRLLVEDPNALLIGFVLDQQVTVQKAFSGPLELQRRLGHLDPARIAAMPAEEFAEVARTRPALHRFPGAMAARIQALCAALADGYGGDAGAIWRTAGDAGELRRRLAGLPGLGPLKVSTILVLLRRQYALDLEGLEELLPEHPTLGEVDSPEALAAYQAGKRAAKAAKRRAAGA